MEIKEQSNPAIIALQSTALNHLSNLLLPFLHQFQLWQLAKTSLMESFASRKDRPVRATPALDHLKARYVEVLDSDYCGCSISRTIKSQGKLGSLGKIWPLFRNFPTDFVSEARHGRHASRRRSKGDGASRSARSVSPSVLSRSSGSEACGDGRTPALEHACIADMFDTELESQSKKLDVELLDSSYVLWEDLSSALEREYEALGKPCRRKRNADRGFLKSSDEDWAVKIVTEEFHESIKNGSSKSTASAIANRSSHGLGISDRCVLREPMQNKLSLKAEVGLNFISTSQFGEIMEKAGMLLEEFCDALLSARRAAMKKPSEQEMLRLSFPHVTFVSSQHVKFGMQACINQAVFRDFQTEAYGLRNSLLLAGIDRSNASAKTRLRQVTFLKEFYICEILPAEELMDPESGYFNESFQLFCRKKLKAVQKAVGWLGRWPSNMCETFLESMKRVWMTHKLAFALENPAVMFYVNEEAEWDEEYMEVVDCEEREETRRRLYYEIVQFMVLPGFFFREEGVVKSKVFLKPKEGAMRTIEEEEGEDN